MTQSELNKQLLKAAGKGHLELVKSLIENGANIEAKNDFNNTALILASNNSLDVVKYLIEKGANINAKNINNNSSLHFASLDGYLDIIKFLVQNGADIEIKNKYNSTALDSANRRNTFKVVKYLKNDAWIESTLGPNYDYTKSRKQQIIDAINKNPSIIDKLNKEELKNIPEIRSLLKSDEYGLFERKILKNMKNKKYSKFKYIKEYLMTPFDTARFLNTPSDPSTNISGYTMQRNSIVTNFQNWIDDNRYNIIEVPNYKVSDFIILKIIDDQSNFDIKCHIAFKLNDVEYFGVFSNLCRGEVNFNCEIFNQAVMDRNFSRRLNYFLLDELSNLFTPKVGKYIMIDDSYDIISEMGEKVSLIKDDEVEVIDFDLSGNKNIQVKFKNINCNISDKSFWLFKKYFRKLKDESI